MKIRLKAEQKTDRKADLSMLQNLKNMSPIQPMTGVNNLIWS